ncbi:MAG: transposase [Gemmataceae bacterium]
MNTREAKAIELADRGRVVRNGDKWFVFSLTSTERYDVTLEPLCCTCSDFELRHENCKHTLAARIALSRDGFDHRTEQKPEHAPVQWPKKTYKQDWVNYNLAQQNEKAEFQRLLADLCGTVSQPEPKNREKGGKPPLLLSDAVFASVFKVYCGTSGRRFTTDLREAKERGYVSQAIHHSTIADFLGDTATTQILTNLIETSALPFNAIETEFAVDSSGFSASKFDRWYSVKHLRVKSEQRWVKAHAMTGTSTHVITSAVIDKQDSGDPPHFAPLVKKTAQQFTINQVSGDKAYTNADSFQVTKDCGGTAYLAFKVNTSGSIGGIFERMYHLFCLNKEDYLHHYHRRSNIESTFSAVKRLFGDSVRSKNETAMRNEVLGKFLAYNITLLVHAIYELKLDPKFGESECEEEPAILPLIRQAGR